MAQLEISQSFGAWLRQPTLSRRLAAMLLLSLVAIQAQAFLQVSYFSRPEFRLVGTRWLAETVAQAAREAFAKPQHQRALYLSAYGERERLRLYWRTGEPPAEPDDSATMIAAQFASTMRDVLGDDLKALHIRASTIQFRFPINTMRVTASNQDMAQPPDRSAIRAGAPDVLIHAGLRVSIQGRDGWWIEAEPVGFFDEASGIGLPFAPLLVGGVIIAAVSTLSARRIMAPLDRLVLVAERVGTAREPVHVESKGLHEFAGVARAFEDMQHRLLRFVEDRTRILAAISHDLRTSLTRLRLAAEQCEGEAERRALESEIEEMRTMVESTLTFASGEAQLAPTQITDVAALLISLVDEASDAGKSARYDGPDHLETMAHPVSLKRAFWNVIDNALKYGTSARVTLIAADANVVIEVCDDGPGIPEDAREDVFAPFRRLDASRSGETPGVGLGLTIARDVMLSHGGSIALSTPISGGLRVELRLPKRA
jgi:signal transduction histidine kinase